MQSAPGGPTRTPSTGPIKSPLDFAGGVFLLALAALGHYGAFSLPVGYLSGIGSGLLPKAVATLVGLFGIALLVQSLIYEGDHLERFGIRGPVFVLGAVLVFAMTIRPLGLVVAGPLAVIVASLADRDTRPLEVAIFAVVMTLLCGILFKELLNLPIPFDPVGLVPDFLNGLYAGFKSFLGQIVTGIKSLFVR